MNSSGMNKVHWLVVMVCWLCPTPLSAQSTPYYQSHAIMKRIRPGVTAQAIQDEAKAAMEPVFAKTPFSKPIYEKAARNLVERGGGVFSHPIGMAVHDDGGYSREALKPGQVFSIDPQLRVPEESLYIRSLDKGLWQKSYAGSNPDEFFAELTMWYFGTHGDLYMTGPKPENGAAGLKKYDPDAYALLDDFYSGRIEISRVGTVKRRRRSDAHNPDSTPPAADSAARKETRRQ